MILPTGEPSEAHVRVGRVADALLGGESRVVEHLAGHPLVDQRQPAGDQEGVVETRQRRVPHSRVEVQGAAEGLDDTRVVGRLREPSPAVDQHPVGGRARVLVTEDPEDLPNLPQICLHRRVYRGHRGEGVGHGTLAPRTWLTQPRRELRSPASTGGRWRRPWTRRRPGRRSPRARSGVDLPAGRALRYPTRPGRLGLSRQEARWA